MCLCASYTLCWWHVVKILCARMRVCEIEGKCVSVRVRTMLCQVIETAKLKQWVTDDWELSHDSHTCVCWKSCQTTTLPVLRFLLAPTVYNLPSCQEYYPANPNTFLPVI